MNIIDMGKSDFILASLGPAYYKYNLLGVIDTRIAEIIPCWLASGWYFAFSNSD
jgi:hypothetical protein